jgi:hypothetical protein
MPRRNWREIPNNDIPAQAAGISVTLNPRGHIAMSRKTHELLGEPEGVIVSFDDANSCIGLRKAHLSTRNVFHVSLRDKKTGGKVVYARRLMTEAKIVLPQTIQFYDADIDEDGILILDLRTARVPRRVLNNSHNKKKKTGDNQPSHPRGGT